MNLRLGGYIMADNSNQGFASMSDEEQRSIASKGGQNSPTQFKPGDARTKRAAKKGAANQPTEAKQRGGMNSRRSS
jgi:general stress protein YciG